jgi:hypothetical protein
MLSRLIQTAKRNPLFRGVYYSPIGHHLVEGTRWHLLRSRSVKTAWRQRAALLLECRDNARIPRVEDAGRLLDGCLIMHNGLRVRPDSYYNYATLRMMQRNRGVHEPQEEFVFQQVLPLLPPGATMLELGAYWGFYSMWFSKTVPGSRAVLVEPMKENLELGRENFGLNRLEGAFVHAFVGETPGEGSGGGPRTVTVDQLMSEQGLAYIDLLHSDIQGFEVQMLDGAAGALAGNRIGWCFISTHSDECHRGCLERLARHGFVIVAAHTKEESFSGDGLIVARHRSLSGPTEIPIERRGVRREAPGDLVGQHS